LQSSLEQLDNDQAILLMYLADELGAADRAAVDARLASDVNLRVELQELQAMEQAMGQSLAALDASQPIAERSAPTQRKVFRHIRQWQADRMAAAALAARSSVRKRSRFMWQLLPLGTAAALVGLMIWWTWTNDPQLPPEENFPHLNADPNAVGIPWQLDSRDNSLAEAEQDMDAISELRTLTRKPDNIQ
jgi:hypothetical protein